MNNLLDSLDTNVGDVVENQVERYDDIYNIDEVGGQSSVDDILAKRGLLNTTDDFDDDADDDADQYDDADDVELDADDADDADNIEEMIDFIDNGADDLTQVELLELKEDPEGHSETAAPEKIEGGTDVRDSSDLVKDTVVDDSNNDLLKPMAAEDDTSVLVPAENGDATDEPPTVGGTETEENAAEDDYNDQDLSNDKTSSGDTVVQGGTEELPEQDESEMPTATGRQMMTKTKGQPATGSQNEALMITQIADLKGGLEAQQKIAKKANQEANTAVKETRKLRRNLVKLNADLDSAERELEAQRTELERAAARIEKDRQRYKEEKDRLELGHKEDLKSVVGEHKASITAMAAAHAKQISDMEERIERAEEARAREGGDMSAELADATERERDTLKKVISLEEDNSTLTSHVSSLQTQIFGLESRIESLHQTAESSSEQEREADDRLDAALSVHARQLSQRQAREAELERTIADLGAALVVARQRETQLLNNGVQKSENNSGSGISELKDKLLSAKDEVEMLNAQLMMERQKSETFQQELEDVTNEQAHETSAALESQKQYDARVADLNATITRLQLKQHSFKQSSNVDESEDGSESSNATADKLQKQVAALSEDLIRQRAKLQNSSTEVQTLHNRLKSALSRAEIAEKAAQVQSPQNMDVYDVERGPGSNHIRQKFGVRARRNVTSISSALKLDTGRSETREGIGKIVDSIDTSAIAAGSFFRSDPIARAFFLLYLLILHLWAFCLVIFHAHGSLEPASNIGPEELLKHSYRYIEQANNIP